MACFFRYFRPPASSSAPRIISFRSAVSLLGMPLWRPLPALGGFVPLGAAISSPQHFAGATALHLSMEELPTMPSVLSVVIMFTLLSLCLQGLRWGFVRLGRLLRERRARTHAQRTGEFLHKRIGRPTGG